MILKNTIRLLLGLLVLSAIGCEEAPNENLTKSNDTILLTTVVDVKMSTKPEAISASTSKTDETFRTHRSIYTAPEVTSKSVNIDDARETFGTDAYVLNDAKITEDTLMLNVSYSGGCKSHKFTLLASDSFLELCPAEMDISLSHDANGDLCRAWLTEDYHFNLTPIKTLYQETYQQESGSVILHLKAPLDEIVNIVYEFSM